MIHMHYILNSLNFDHQLSIQITHLLHLKHHRFLNLIVIDLQCFLSKLPMMMMKIMIMMMMTTMTRNKMMMMMKKRKMMMMTTTTTMMMMNSQ
uniref:Uncharacterized protein n=1 Tax=Schistosoma curassoni TaxID=6186 RepID=A0A183K0I2_9TREM